MVFHAPVPARGTSDARVFTYREVTTWCASARAEYCGPRKEEATRAEQKPPGIDFHVPSSVWEMSLQTCATCTLLPSTPQGPMKPLTWPLRRPPLADRFVLPATRLWCRAPEALGVDAGAVLGLAGNVCSDRVPCMRDAVQ